MKGFDYLGEEIEGVMLSTGNNGSRGGGTLSSDMPPLPQCLPLESITLSNQKYTRSGELRRVLGVPLGSSSEDHSFGVTHPKPLPPVATEELKHFKESVQDASKKARWFILSIYKIKWSLHIHTSLYHTLK